MVSRLEGPRVMWVVWRDAWLRRDPALELACVFLMLLGATTNHVVSGLAAVIRTRRQALSPPRSGSKRSIFCKIISASEITVFGACRILLLPEHLLAIGGIGRIRRCRAVG